FRSESIASYVAALYAKKSIIQMTKTKMIEKLIITMKFKKSLQVEAFLCLLLAMCKPLIFKGI
ncbi:hypothetical protein D8T58_22290, partial [Vibrio vulnificus]